MKSCIWFTIVFAACAASSCGIHRDSSIYSEVVSLIPLDLRHFFPMNLNCTWARLTFNELPFDNSHQSKSTFYYLEVMSTDFKNISSEQRLKSIATYRFSDSCNIVVSRFQRNDGFYSPSGRESLYRNWIKSVENCSDRRLPIPNFAGLDYPDFIQGIGLSDDYEILVHEANMNSTLDQKYQSETILMPETWRHGYSRGVCIDDSNGKMIWWLVAW